LIQIDGRTYEIITHKGNKAIIYRFADRIKNRQCGMINSSSQNDLVDITSTHKDKQSICAETKVRILVLTTPEARDQVINPTYAINTAIQQLQIALRNSLISQTAVSVVLAGIVHTDFDETGDPLIDVNSLSGLYSDLREIHNADLVVMMTSDMYPAIGVVDEIGPLNESAYAMSSLIESSSTMNFAHEVGHLFGARHDNDTDGTFNRAHLFSATCSFIFPRDRRTILGGGLSSYERVLYFSTPHKDYCGTPLGEVNRNNARQISESGFEVANFMPNPTTPFAVYITGPWSICNCQYEIYKANTQCPNGTVSFNWEYSTDGINFQNGYNQNTAFELQSGCNDTNSGYVVRVTATDGFTTSVSTKNVSRSSYGCNNFNNIDIIESTGKKIEEIESTNFRASISPNPVIASGSIHIEEIPEDSNLNVTIFNANSQVAFDQSFQSATLGKNHKILLPDGLKSGLYFVKVEVKGKSQFIKLFVK